MSDQSSGSSAPPLFRPLLPAPKPSPASDSVAPSLPQRHYDFKKRRQAAACEPCREHKTKCDGSRPSCLTCLRRGSECRFEADPKETHMQALKRKYEALQDERTAQQHICELLRTRSENEAMSIFRRLRGGERPEVIMRHVQHGDLLLQLSLRSESDSQLGSPGSEPYSDSHSSSTSTAQPLRDDSRLYSGRTVDRGPRHTALPYSRHNVECEVVEPLIDMVQPSRWTNVAADDGVIRNLLRVFFQLDLSWFHVPILHKECFLRDMASGNTENCSSLLVNAVLACACVGASDGLRNTGRDWDPEGKLGRGFFAEVTQQWEREQERKSPCLTTVQAGFLLHILHGLGGPGTKGWTYTARSIQIAQNMGIFDTQSYGTLSPKAQHTQLFTAWSAFCWQSLWCYHFSIPPLLAQPPVIPLPEPYNHPEWYGEIRVRYPDTGEVRYISYGLLFKAKAELLVTMNESCYRLHRPRSDSLSSVLSRLREGDQMDHSE